MNHQQTVATHEPDRLAKQRDERILILAPTGGDQEIIAAAAAEGCCTAEIVADMAHLCAAIDEGAGALVLVDAAFSPADIASLRAALRKQPAWSALPILLICADVAQEEARQRFLHLVGLLHPMGQNVHKEERPLDSRLLIEWFEVALHERRSTSSAAASSPCSRRFPSGSSCWTPPDA
jgi:CheY-like chemotaxis protein